MFEAVTSQLMVLGAAILYWQCYAPSTTTGGILGAALNLDISTLASATTLLASNRSLTNLPNVSAAKSTLGNSTGAGLLVGKVDPRTLLAVVGTLIGVWTMAVVGLSFTIKRECLHMFWSTQTGRGCAFSRAFFLDNEGNDARRTSSSDSMSGTGDRFARA